MSCRICGKNTEQIAQLSHIPASAQNFLNKDELGVNDSVDLNLLMCGSCGVIQHDLEPVGYYRDVIRATAYSGEMKLFRQEQLREFVKKHGLTGRKSLEIGCGKGEYLTLLNEAGLHAFGIENNADSVGVCTANCLNAVRGYLGDSVFEEKMSGEPFGAFFSFNFFEHIPCVTDTLAALKDIITDEAVGLIEVPNFDMVLKENLISEIIPDHIYYFTKDSFTNLLGANGFEVLSCEAVWHDYILSAEVRKRRKPDMAAFMDNQQRITNAISGFVSQYEGRKIAVWGAGHQSLAALSMCGKDLASRFCFVIDSAPFKQNKYTPATHLPVVPPDILNETKVDAVLIIAAAYSGEIADYIKNNHSHIETAILKGSSIQLV